MTPEALIIETMLQIADKDGNDVPFVLNPAQRLLDSRLTGRDLVPKARQEGVSSYVLGRYLAACLMRRNVRAVVISHDQESTQRMLRRVMYYIEHMRGPKPVIKNMSANEITFPKMDSMFYIGTAGSRRFGRGDTITHLHCSEYAYWPNPANLIKGLFQAVPKSGEIIIESTGNGYNDYHRRCMRAYQGKSLWGVHFLPWNTFPEYTLDLSIDESERFMSQLDEELEEPRLAAFLSPGQLAWRRMKLEELDFDMLAFKQEYPMTIDECFQATSQSVFHKVVFGPTARWKKVDRGTFQLDGHPREDLTYVIGADVSGGVGKDASVAEVLCVDTNEQVYEYITNRLDPEAFGDRIVSIARMFNMAFIVPEQNNHGILTLNTIQKQYPHGKIYSGPVTADEDDKRLMQMGYRTTKRTKPLMIGALRAALAHEEIRVYSSTLNNELSTFIEFEDGSMGAQDGCHDDTVIALACAYIGLGKAALAVAFAKKRALHIKKRTPFSFDSIIEDLESAGRKWPIAPQIDRTIN
jgi:hypothetical protein